MNRLTWLSVPIMVLLAAAGYWLGGSGWLADSGKDDRPLLVLFADTPCTLDAEGCRFQTELGFIHLRGRDSIRALDPFEVRLEVTFPVSGAEILFTMEGMDMGLNLFRFRETGAGVWVTNATLPVCTADRADWLAALTVDTEEIRLRAIIPFTAG
jgi:hypothetical protein